MFTEVMESGLPHNWPNLFLELSRDELDQLNANVTNEEIKSVVFLLKVLKPLARMVTLLCSFRDIGISVRGILTVWL